MADAIEGAVSWRVGVKLGAEGGAEATSPNFYLQIVICFSGVCRGRDKALL